MCINPKKRGTALLQSRVSFLALLSIACCVHAGDPEQFVANPRLLDDFTSTTPLTGSTGGFKYHIIEGYAVMEGDILLGKVNQHGLIPSSTRARGLGLNSAFGRWPDGIVPYLSPTSNSAVQRENIALAIEHWTEQTSITFVELSEVDFERYPNYLRFISSTGCASYVGMTGGEQEIMVSDTCSTGSIVHEVGHALGLFHEHTRPDRDNFIQVDAAQIEPGKEDNFAILNAGVETYGPYDYGSIMHYGEYFFTDTGKKTIIAPGGIKVGQRKALSAQDAASVNLMYATDLALLQPSINTTGNGLEVDLTISNQGSLGAQQLQLTIALADDSEWIGVSSNSGWECLSFDAELRCSRPTLSEQSESRFTLLADPASGSADDLGILLTSRTLDTNTSNNVYNDTYVPQTSSDDNLNTGAPEDIAPVTEPEPTPGQNTPIVAAAKGGSGSADDASAGADNGSLMGLTLLALAWQRRRRYRD